MRRGMKDTLVSLALKQIDDWLKQTGVPPSRLGLLACANARAVERVRAGSGSVASLEAILAYIEAHPAKERRQ